MVARSAPSRPIRVTVTFATRLDHSCSASLRVGEARSASHLQGPPPQGRQAGQVGKSKGQLCGTGRSLVEPEMISIIGPMVDEPRFAKFEAEVLMQVTSYGLFWRADDIEWFPGKGNRDEFRLLGRIGPTFPKWPAA